MSAPKLDLVLEIKNHIAAYNAMVAGTFKDEIKALEQKNAELSKLTAAYDTAKKIEQARKNADAYFEMKTAEADKLQSVVDAREDALNIREIALDERRTQDIQERDILNADKQQFRVYKIQVEGQLQNDQNVIAELRKQAQVEKDSAVAIRQELEAKLATVNAKLEAIKSL